MPDYSWPDNERRTRIDKRIPRVDAAVKVSGAAKYTYDHRPGMLYGKIVALAICTRQSGQRGAPARPRTCPD